jgi:hypothetical protein
MAVSPSDRTAAISDPALTENAEPALGAPDVVGR